MAGSGGSPGSNPCQGKGPPLGHPLVPQVRPEFRKQCCIGREEDGNVPLRCPRTARCGERWPPGKYLVAGFWGWRGLGSTLTPPLTQVCLDRPTGSHSPHSSPTTQEQPALGAALRRGCRVLKAGPGEGEQKSRRQRCAARRTL